jgi:hypothetical protein
MLEQLILGPAETTAIEDLVNRVCAGLLGSPAAEILFRFANVGAVFGVRLQDGRHVVVKAHQPRETARRLAAVHEVQRTLWRAGFPCPEPLAGPVRFGEGLATVERLLDAGERRDAHHPAYRRLIAEALAWQLELAGDAHDADALAGGWSLHDSPTLWPAQAHAPQFDLAATADGAQWIDAIAMRAREQAAGHDDDEPPVAGHSDWSARHVRFSGRRISAVYDWDSLKLASEAAIVGNAAVTFPTTFDRPGIRRAPTPEEARAFVDDYSRARAEPLTRAQRTQIAACATLLAAYTARCEHCLPGGDDDSLGFIAALRDRGSEYLQP